MYRVRGGGGGWVGGRGRGGGSVVRSRPKGRGGSRRRKWRPYGQLGCAEYLMWGALSRR